MSINMMHRTLADLSKPAGNIPTGVWNKIRGIKLTAKEVTKTNRDGEEFEAVEFTLSAEAVEPSSSVDPDALAEIDTATGKPSYEGKRLFLRYSDAFRSDMTTMAAAMTAFGIPADASLQAIVDGNLVKGKVASGEIFNRDFKRNDGSDGVEQKVRSWAQVGTAHGFTL